MVEVKISSARTATTAYRSRLADRGLARMELRARRDDRDLLRAVASKLANDDAAAASLRAALRDAIGSSERGGVWAALRSSPLVGVDLDLERAGTSSSPIEL